MRNDPRRKELVRAVIRLGQSLGKRVVAEGVETEEDLLELAAMGCECAQGWLIGRPMSAEATEAGLPDIAPLARRDPAVRAEDTVFDGPHYAEMEAEMEAVAETLLPNSIAVQRG